MRCSVVDVSRFVSDAWHSPILLLPSQFLASTHCPPLGVKQEPLPPTVISAAHSSFLRGSSPSGLPRRKRVLPLSFSDPPFVPTSSTMLVPNPTVPLAETPVLKLPPSLFAKRRSQETSSPSPSPSVSQTIVLQLPIPSVLPAFLRASAVAAHLAGTVAATTVSASAVPADDTHSPPSELAPSQPSSSPTITSTPATSSHKRKADALT